MASSAAPESDSERCRAFWVLGEDRVSAVSEDGSVTGSYSLGRNYLKGCSFGGNGFAVLLLSRYRAGSAGQAVVVGPDGTETASLTLPANVLDLDDPLPYRD